MTDLDAGMALRMADAMGQRIWSKQREMIECVFGPRRSTVVQSSTGTGKTRNMGLLAWLWCLTGRDRLVITTAPTMRQVDGGVWRQMRAISKEASAIGVTIGGNLAPKAANLVCSSLGSEAKGYSSTKDGNYAGWHSPGGTLVIVDEAQHMDSATWDTLRATLTGANDRFIAVGNPVRSSGRFFEFCTQVDDGVVNKIKIGAFDSPNVRAGRTILDGLVSAQFVEECRLLWGEDSPLWRSRVLGEFADSDERALVPMSWVDFANKEWAALAPVVEGLTPERVMMGADVARLGKDSGATRIFREYLTRERLGGRVIVGAPIIHHPKSKTMETAGFLVGQFREYRPDVLNIDADGLGAGIVDRIEEIGVPVTGLRGAGSANDTDRFVNARAEWLYSLRDMLRPHTKGDARPTVCFPQDGALMHQMTTLRIEEASNGKIKMQSKDTWRIENGGRSPDELDATAYALAEGKGGGLASFIAAYGR